MAVLILTRPAAASRGFARRARAGGFDGPILFAPVMDIIVTGRGPLPEGTLVFTSASGVAAASRMGPLAGRRVVAVGPRTAAAAAARGARAEALGGCADALAAALIRRGGGPFRHLHGTHVTGDLAGRLRRAGLDAEARAIYDQRSRALTDAARAALMSDRPAILPLFSPRAARLIAADLPRKPLNTKVIAFSPAVADGWPWPREALVAKHVDGASMLDAVTAVVVADRGD